MMNEEFLLPVILNKVKDLSGGEAIRMLADSSLTLRMTKVKNGEPSGIKNDE